MTLTLLSSRLLKICLILTASRVCLTFDDTYESDSNESTDVDSGTHEDSSENMQLVLTGILRQTLVYHMALMDTRKSEVCSPLSALLPLGKLAMGTSSRRYKEFREVLGYRRSKVVSKFQTLMSQLSKISGKVQLTIASRLYVSNRHSLRSQFDTRVRRVFKSSCERVDFQDAKGTAASINDWVNMETRGFFKNIIKPGEISQDTSLIITNVVYFKGRWKNRFTNVMESKFFTPSGERKVWMMSRTDEYKYTKSDRLQAQIIEIPYSGNDVSFVVILPTANDGLPSLLRELMKSPERLNQALSKMDEVKVRVYIPKFKITSNLDLSSLYHKMGMAKILDRNNKILTKVVKGHNVHISKAVHRAVIDVNEFGTEAAGVSVAQMAVLSAVVVNTEFRANHPFLFYVLSNGEQLFGGVYNGD